MTDDWNMDPRPDLADDHEAWHHLLMHARAIDGAETWGLYGTLDGLRCLGARLATVNGKARIFRGDIAEDEYARLREKWLMPHKAKLIELLETHERWINTRADAKERPAASATAAGDDVQAALL